MTGGWTEDRVARPPARQGVFPIRFTVIGPGAIGSLMAARLVRAGCPAQLLDHHPERAARLRRSGITIEEDGSEWTVFPDITDRVEDAIRSDCLMVCVKAYDTASLCRQLAPWRPLRPILLTLQNGLGNVETFEALDPATLLAGVTGAGAFLTEPGRIRFTGNGATVMAAVRDPDQALDRVIESLQSAGIPTHPHTDWRVMVWEKLVLNAAINPLTALYGIPNGELPGHPDAGALAMDIIAEAIAVAAAGGIMLDKRERMEAFESVCRQTAYNHSSMLQDLEQGRRTEKNAILGTLLDLADRRHVPAPSTRRTFNMLSAPT